ncbi:MAG: glucosylglycerol hydrolase, partial [Aggregatilineales bacterium]
MRIIKLLEARSRDVAAWQHTLENDYENDRLRAMRQIVRRLGVHIVNGIAEIGFWTPEFIDDNIAPENIFLEVLQPLAEIDFTQPWQTVQFNRQRIPMIQQGEFSWAVVEGMQPGSREQVGDFYQVVYQDNAGGWQRIPDYVAHSIPFGAFAPAEFYDMPGMFADRADASHFGRLHTV